MEKIKINKREMTNIYGVLSGLRQVANTKFAYVVMRNMNYMETEIKIIRELGKPNKEFIEYDNKRFETCKKYAEKDKSGNPIYTGDRQRFVIKDQENFDKEIVLLKEEYKDVISAFENKQKEINTMLNEEDVEIKVYKIKQENLPDNLNVIQLKALEHIIE